MKNVVKRNGTSQSRDYIVLAIIGVLIATALVAGTVVSAHKAKLASASSKQQSAARMSVAMQGKTDKKASPKRGTSAPSSQMWVEDEDEDGMAKTNDVVEGSEEVYGPFNYDIFLEREKAGEFPYQGSQLPSDVPFDALTNNNNGSIGTANFTQSETSVVAFGNTIVIAYNDSGSNAGGSNKFTGFSRSTDGGITFTDGGALPTNAGGDAGDPVLARNETTGRIYLATLGFSVPTVQVFRSDDNGATWQAPVNGTPGGASEDKEWIAVDNFAGPGNGNVYLLSRNFGAGNGIFFYRSTDNGATFGPNAGINIVSGNQGAFVAVGPNHAIYTFWYAGTTLQGRKSTDQGATFGAPVTVASGLVGGTNGDLGLTGIRQGTSTPSGFRSSEFPHAAVNPVNGNIYVTFDNKGAGSDKGDVFLTQSTDGGLTWSAPLKVNDDSTTTDQWQPTIAVTPDGANLGIFYYSRQEDTTNNNLFKYYGRTASIAGSTLSFSPSFAISDTPSLPEFGRDSVVNSVYMGDYNTAFATSGQFHVVWSDNRDDLPGGSGRKDPQVYYDSVNLTIHVTTTVPLVNSIISTQPTTFTVNISEPANPASLAASDFTVNGIPATSFSYTPGSTTITFTFSSTPVTVQGLQTMHIAAGAFTSAAAGDPVAEFTGTFRYDTVQLMVTSTVPPFPGGVFTLPGPFTYDVNFNEAIDPSSVQTGDLTLSGITGASVTGVTVLPGNTTARFTLNIASEGTLTASIAGGAITDQFGNPGAPFSATYGVDIGTVPYPAPLLAKNPLGSMVYDPGVSGTINFAGDTDNFTLAIDPGQTITVVATPTSAGLRPTVTLRDPSSAVLGTATAAAAGQNALLQTVPAVAAGTYTFTMSGDGGTTGNYTMQVILNAAQEAEGTLPGFSNNTPATAQDLNPAFTTVSTSQSSAQRAAALGTSDNAGYAASAIPFTFENIQATGTVIAGLTGQDDASVSIPVGFSFPFYGNNNTTVFVSSNGLLTFGGADATFTNADLTTAPNLAGIAPFWDDQFVTGPGTNVFFQVLGSGSNQHLTIQWINTFFSGGTAGDNITYEAQLYVDGRIQFNYLDLVSGSAPGNNGGSATVGIKAAGAQGLNRLLLAFNNGPNAFVGTGQSTLVTPPTPTPDFYSFTLNTGDVTTLGLKNQGMGNMQVDLLDSSASVVATGVVATNLDSVINNYTAAAGGTYYARVTAPAANNYNLVVTRNAAFDTEANDTAATAQPIGGNRGALGGLAPSAVYLATPVAFSFEDISSTGTVIAGLTGQDDASVSIPVGFAFPFYGTNNTTVFVSSNGLLTFGGGDTTFTNADMTTSPALAGIAPFWDDQFVTGPGTNVFFQVLGSGSNQHLTIQWVNNFFSGGTSGDNLVYEAQLFADGRIQFNYQDLVSGTAAGNNGASATVGIKAAGTQGPNRLLLAFNNGPNSFVGTGQSTLITQPPSDDWYSVTLGAGQSTLQFVSSTPADGPGEFVNILNPRIQLFDNTGAVLIASGIVLADGRNESIAATGLTPGATYKLRVSSEGGTTGEYFVSSGPSAPFSNAGATLVNESCPPTNGAIDPGERVTVGLKILNNSGASTSNLVATLQSTGGVVAPTGPQSYGAIPNGGMAERQFAFTASAGLTPGQIITATLQLQDGASNLGSIDYTFIAGPAPCGSVRLVVTQVLSRTSPSTVQAVITVQNIGALTASNTNLTVAQLGATGGTLLPQSLGSIAPGASVSATVNFNNSTPGTSTLKVQGNYSTGTFSSNARVSVP